MRVPEMYALRPDSCIARTFQLLQPLLLAPIAKFFKGFLVTFSQNFFLWTL